MSRIHANFSGFIFVFFMIHIAALLILYTGLRMIVSTLERTFIRWGKPRYYALRKKLREAENLQSWRKTADKLDLLQKIPENKIKKHISPETELRVTQLRQAREEENLLQMIFILQEVLSVDQKVMNEKVYSYTFIRQIDLVTDFFREVNLALQKCREMADDPNVSHEELIYLKKFLKKVSRDFSKTALMLSGGGAFALHHFGVVEVLHKEKILPKVVSGTSGGALVAALVCTHTDEELTDLLKPEKLVRVMQCFDGSWPKRLYNLLVYKAMWDSKVWYAKVKLLLSSPEITFIEAYERTGRILNVSICDVSQKTPRRVILNHEVSPNVIVASSITASAAFPGFIRPHVILEKDPVTHGVRPWHGISYCTKNIWNSKGQNRRYVDGSLSNDIPTDMVTRDFETNFFITSQVNPHISPFFYFKPEGDSGAPLMWRSNFRGGFLLSFLEVIIKESIFSLFKIMLVSDLWPQRWGLNKFQNVFLQDMSGDVVLFPTSRALLWKCAHALSDPTLEDFRFWWQGGREMIFRKMFLIQSRIEIERNIEKLETVLCQRI